MMTTISSISPSAAAGAYAVPGAMRAATSAGAPAATPSAIVQLSAEGLAAAAMPPSTASRYKDLGAALLDRLGKGHVAPLGPDKLPTDAANRFVLGIVTAGGKHVDLALADAGGDTIVQVRADEDLSDDERAALAGLAKGFQAAIDGLAQDPPQIRLSGLTGFDSRILQSVDLRAAVALPGVDAGTQALDVHLDAASRKVAVDGPSGQVNVGIDASRLETLGTRQQQARAIDSYLKQFDEAAARGHADPGLTQMFKDTFAALSATATRDRPATGSRWALSQDDHAVLTGLADFDASVTQTPGRDNPLRRNEVDGFGYTVSQQTRTGGATPADRSVVQVQHAHLTAQFHQPLKDDGVLRFKVPPDQQNYNYHEIDDVANAQVELGYKDGRLQTATMEQSVSQSERIRKYVLGKLQSDRTTPASMHLARDLVAALAPYQADGHAGSSDDTKEDRERRRLAALDALSANVYLVGTRRELAARDVELGPAS